MEDRELLEMAAKAAGMVVLERPWNSDDGWFFCGSHGKPAMHFHYAANPHRHIAPWMPLHDDGDALRLVVNLRLSVNPYEEGIFVSRYEHEPVISECHGKDSGVSTRRAIVRAAAAIGEAMS